MCVFDVIVIVEFQLAQFADSDVAESRFDKGVALLHVYENWLPKSGESILRKAHASADSV